MKAAVLNELGAPFQIQEVPEPQIGADEVLIRTESCGICRTDVHIQDGLAYVPSLPHIPGHEPAGVVTAIGEDVDDISVGDRVVPHLFLTCGCCHYCRTGRDAQCDTVEGIIGVTCPGAFAEYFSAPAKNLLKLPDNVSSSAGGLVSCAVITAVHAYRRTRLTVGDTAVVLGAGGIGQILIQILKNAGIQVVAISRSEESLQIASRLGAQLTIPLNAEDAGRQVADFSAADGADCVFECVGTSQTMKVAAACIRRGGQIIVIGEEPEFPEIDTIQIAQREIEIIGSRNGSLQDAADAIEWMRQGIIDPPIVQKFPLEQLNEAIELVRCGKAHGRVVIEF